MKDTMELPPDLLSFLVAGRKLDYDADECEMGAIDLLPLESLRLQLFPTDVDNGPLDNSLDPHYREMGCYLVPAVSLVAECDGYDPLGLLLWFPNEKCFGTWDSSHTLLESFSTEITWSHIANEPARYFNAFWGEDRVGGLQPLVPWPHYEYDVDQTNPATSNKMNAEPSRAPKPANGSNLMDAITRGLGDGSRSSILRCSD